MIQRVKAGLRPRGRERKSPQRERKLPQITPNTAPITPTGTEITPTGSFPPPIEVKDRYKNDWERQYASYLEQLRHLKQILWWGYECWGFRLADNTFHYPDFPIVTPTHFEIHDVKGRKRETWLVKVKTCKDLYPWIKWAYVKKEKGNWVVRYI